MKKENRVVWFVVLAVLAIVLFKYSNQFSVLSDAYGLPYSINDTALSYSIIKASSSDFGTTGTTEGDTYSTTENINNPGTFGIDSTFVSYRMDNVGTRNRVVTTNLNLKPEEFDEILIDYAHDSSVSGCVTGGGARSYSQIWIVDKVTQKEFSLYQSKVLNPGTVGSDSYLKSGRLYIFRNRGEFVFDVDGNRQTILEFGDGGPYELVLVSDITNKLCGHVGANQHQEITITNIKIKNRTIEEDGDLIINNTFVTNNITVVNNSTFMNNTVVIDKTVTEQPTFFDRFGMSAIVLVLFGGIVIYLIRTRGRR